MAISFPTSLDNFTNPSSGNTLDSPSHSLQHSDINDAVEAMQRKVGVGTAVAGSASAGQVLTISAAGTSTWSTPSSSGFVLLTTQTFSGVSSVSLPADTFTATYENYKIMIDFVPTASDTIGLRLRSSGSDDTAAQYNNASFNVRVNNSSGISSANASQTRAVFESIVANFKNSISIDIFSPKLAKYTTGVGLFHMGISASDAKMYFGGFQLSNTTTYDSITWLMGSGNMTGTISAYGYSK